MTAYWQFLVESLQQVLGMQLGLIVAEVFCVIIVLAIVTPLVMVLRGATNLRSGGDDTAGGSVISSLPNESAVISQAQPSGVPAASPALTGEVQAPADSTGSSIQPAAPRSSSAAFNVLTVAVIMAAVSAILTFSLISASKGPSNVVALFPIIFFVVAIVIVTQSRFRTMFTINPSSSTRQALLRASAKSGESVALRIDNDQLQKLRERFNAGEDIETICREIEPGYATWGLIKQEIFRKAIEMILKAKSGSGAQISSRITLR